jgi:hypothetical protein
MRGGREGERERERELKERKKELQKNKFLKEKGPWATYVEYGVLCGDMASLVKVGIISTLIPSPLGIVN